MLRRICRSTAALLIGALQLFAARSGQLQTKPSLGQIVRSSSATLGGTAVPGGGTIVSGDIMSTAAGGAALVEFSDGNQIDLGENTIVTFSGTPGHVVATLDHGNVAVRALNAGVVVVQTVRCNIASTGQGSASYQIMAPPGSTSIQVSGVQGEVSVAETGGQGHVVHAGETWSCPAVLAGQAREEGAPSAGEQAGQAGAPTVTAHGHTGLLVLLLGGGAAAGIGAALAGGKGGGGGPASPSVP